MVDIARQVAGDRLEHALRTEGKMARAKAIDALREEVKTAILQKISRGRFVCDLSGIRVVEKKMFRANILEKQQRVDGRGYNDLRAITCEVGVLPRAHGSAIFQRGETQALALATLAPIEEAQMIDAYGGGEQSKRFILHYNFPPFSVGWKHGGQAGPVAVRLAMARWPSVRWNRSCRAKTNFVMPSAFPARSWSPTARHRWPVSAAECSR